ncbi:MAG: sugar ABC transporter permease [Thermotoga sp.]|nr:MAG: sugar ABC transporter permease [Thermotoga sp.]
MKKRFSKTKYIPILLILPAIVMLFLLIIFPLIWSFFTSLKRMTLLDLMLHKGKYIGFQNYVNIFKDSLFWNSLKNAFIFVALSVIGQVGFGLLLASILHDKSIKGPGIFRAIFLIPWIISSVVAAYSWTYIFDANLGFLPALAYNNPILKFLGFERKDWLTNPSIVIYILVVINIWKGTAFSILMQSAGLQSIPDSLYESSEVDGATTLQKFVFITLPLLMPFILINLIITTMITFNVYDLILLITGGGPNHASEVLSLYIYNRGFSWGDLGYAASLSLVLLIVNLTVTVLYLVFLRSRETS